MTRVTLHRFESDPALPQRDGVNLAHSEINRLLGEEPHPGIDVDIHDFPRLLRDEPYARQVLSRADCVLCNVGPHAHYYHEMRERLGLSFRIVRDMKTAMWSGYLLQESLCEPLLRDGDVLLVTSEYSRAFARRVFPHLRAAAIHVFEPVLTLQHESAEEPPPLSRREQITLGHLGRLSEDKNFPQMVDLLLELHRREPGRYRLVAVGAVHSPACDPSRVADHVAARTGRHDLFAYRAPVEHRRVLSVLRTFDWFLFFSTSNLEVLGRVLVEAGHAGVSILAADHAAAPELLPPESLLRVTYRAGHEFLSHFDAPMGQVDFMSAADRIQAGLRPPAPTPPVVNRREVLFAAVRGLPPPTPPCALAPEQADFLGRLRWRDLPRYAGREESLDAIAELRDWFSALNAKVGTDFEARLRELERRTAFPERTARFMAATRTTRCDFTNLGGLDIELCNIAGYFPRFALADMPARTQQSETARRG